MPGIVGLITKRPRDWAEPQLQRMVDALRHESFYEAGTWIDDFVALVEHGVTELVLTNVVLFFG